MKKKVRVTPPNESSDKRLNWDVLVKVAAVAVSAATLGFGVYQYVVKPRQEARADVYNRKKELYNQAMDSTSRFASATTQAEAEAARKQFWELYNGRLSVVENREVKEAMQAFGGGVKSWEEFNDPSDFTRPADFEYFPNGQDKDRVTFDQMSYRLTQACRADLETK